MPVSVTFNTAVYGEYIGNISGATPSTAQFPLPVGIRTGENLRSAGLEFDEGDGDGEGGEGEGGGAQQEGPDQDGKSFRVIVGNTSKQAEPLETGTYKMVARRPLGAAMDSSIEPIEGLAEEIFVRLFKEAGVILKKK